MYYRLKQFAIVVSMFFVLLRLGGVSGNVFKDFAHVWTGGLIAAWFVCWQVNQRLDECRPHTDTWLVNERFDEAKWITGILAMALCFVELLASLVLYPAFQF